MRQSLHRSFIINFLPGSAASKEKHPKKRITRFYPSLLSFAIAITITTVINAQDVLVGLTSNGGYDGKGTAFSIKSTGTDFSVLKGFADWGKAPNGDLILGNDGNFYGMTNTGGTYNYTGTIFKMTPSGSITILKQFNGTTEGAYPYGELVKGADGSFYGVTGSGGSNSYGTIFKITTAGVFTLLKTFNYTADGSNPRGHLVLATDGNFYGITRSGGANGYGTIFKMTPAGAFTVLRSLNNATDGGSSYGSLTQGTDGSLYGITYSGGTYSAGTIFKITTAGVFTVLRHLNTPTDGGSSESDLIQAIDGNFYGMCYRGGTNSNGTIFKVTPAGALTVLRNLTSPSDGGYPYGNLYQHNDGNLYGMLTGGGANTSGTVFKITTAGSFTLLHSFVPATEGSLPNGSLIKGNDGYLYGLTSAGGSFAGGTAFKISTSGALTVLANFNGAGAGNTPCETLLKSKDSAFYGTTSGGGKYGNGTVFKICGGATTVLYSFNSNVDGGIPKGSLIQATDGNFYGTTTIGSNNGYGTIFKITPAGAYTVIRSLIGKTDGGTPQGSLLQASDGFLYGMTSAGGTNSSGTIFRISTTGSFTVLRHLAYATDGGNPEGNLIESMDGNLYGVTAYNAKAFKITKAGTFTVLHSFTTAEGTYPLGSLLPAKDGNFYGTTSSTGYYGYGSIFKMSATGTVTILRQINGTTDGKAPKGNLLQGTDGSFYGMTSAGGTNNVGTLFKITGTGTYTVMRNFDINTDGGSPFGSLILAPANNLNANAQSISTNEDVSKAIVLTGSGSNFTVTGLPLHGSISGTGANITYIPAANYNGKDSFYFTTGTGCLSSSPAKISINVAAINDAPVLSVIGNKIVVAGGTITFTATGTDADAGQVLTYSLVSAPAGAFINATSGAFTWKPAATGTYTFKVRLTDNGSPTLYSEQPVTITVSNTVASAPTINKRITEKINARIYPNPVLDKIILTGEFSKLQVRIINESGALLYNQKFDSGNKNQLGIPVENLRPGIYFLKLQTDDESQVIKFIKQ